MLSGPDHSHRGRAGRAIFAAQVVADGLDEAAVGRLVVAERLARLPAPDQVVGQIVIPLSHAPGSAEDLAAGSAPVAGLLAFVALPQIHDGISGQAKGRDSRDQPGHLGQRDGLGAALGQVRAERVIQPPGCRIGAGRVLGRRRGYAGRPSQCSIPKVTAPDR